MLAAESLGRHRASLFATIFLIINGIAVWHYVTSTPSSATADVELSNPQDGRLANRDIVKWKFSHDMVAPVNVGKWERTSPITLSPSVAGWWAWASVNELAFQPDAAWTPCTEFTAVIPSDLTGPTDIKLGHAKTFHLRTAPLSLQSLTSRPISVAEKKYRVSFLFNDSVKLDDFRNHIKVRIPGGNAIPFDLTTDDHGIGVDVNMSNIGTNRIAILLQQGLQGTNGPLGLATDVEREITLATDLSFVSIESEMRDGAIGSIHIRFNDTVDLSSARGFISTEPAVPFDASYWCSGSALVLNGEFKAAHSYSITFHKGLKSQTGLELEHDITRRVYMPEANPSVKLAGSGRYLTSNGSGKLPVTLTNIKTWKASIWRIYPNNLVRLALQDHDYYWYHSIADNIGHLEAELEFSGTTERNKESVQFVDLKPYITNTAGIFAITVRDGESGSHSDQLVIVSDIGATIRASDREILVWANSLRNPAPITNATVCIYSKENQELLTGTTDSNGLAHFAFEPTSLDGVPYLVTVQQGDDITFLPFERSRVNVTGGSGTAPYATDGYEASLFTDRGIYRPGDTIHVRAVVRGTNFLCPPAFPVQLNFKRPSHQTEREIPGMLSNIGTVEFEFVVPDATPTGIHPISLTLPGGSNELGAINVSIEEFVPPQIDVKVSVTNNNKEIRFDVHADYLFGQPASGLSSAGYVEFVPIPFSPTNWPDYSFGDPNASTRHITQRLGTQTLDENGEATFSTTIDPTWRPGAMLNAVAAATVTEMSGRAVARYVSVPVHMYPFYLGVKLSNGTARTQQPCHIQIAAVQPDGTLKDLAATLNVQIDRLEWVTLLKRNDSGYAYESCEQAITVSTQEFSLVKGQATVAFTPQSEGSYRITVNELITEARTLHSFYVGGEDSWAGSRSMEQPGMVELTFDQESYLPGDTARLRIDAPFTGRALFTLETHEVITHNIFTLTNTTTEIEILVEAQFAPNAWCFVSVIRPVGKESIWSTHRACGQTPLMVERPDLKLGVTLDAPSDIKPRTALPVTIHVTDSQGQPADSEITVAAVDEGICMLTGFKCPNPYDSFMRQRFPKLALYDPYGELMQDGEDFLAAYRSSPGGDSLGNIGRRLNPIRSRRFVPLALWSGVLHTDSQGVARTTFDIPEFSGKVHLMAVAVNKTATGSAEAKAQVRSPLTVQTSLPRFIAPGDGFRLPVRLFNDTGSNGTVRVRVTCSGALGVAGTNTQLSSVFLADSSSTNIAFHVTALPIPGLANCTIEAQLGDTFYKEEVELAVRPPAPRVASFGHGIIPANTFSALKLPGDWLSGTGTAELWLSSLPGVKLGGGFSYLMNYPYGCLEQTTSKSFPLLYLKDLADQLYPGWLGKEEIDRLVQISIERILSMQRYDGSFGLWSGSDDSYPWGSTYATHFLVEATKSGYAVPKSELEKALTWLENNNCRRDGFDSDYEQAYVCYVLALAGKRPYDMTIRHLPDDGSQIDPGARLYLGAAFAAMQMNRDAAHVLGNVEELLRSPTEREENGSLRSDTTDQAALLSVLLGTNPNDPSIPLLVKKLEDAQPNGQWYTTRENAMALMALGKYCQLLATRQKPITGNVFWSADGKASLSFTNVAQWHIGPTNGPESGMVRVKNMGDGPIYYYWKSEGIPLSGKVEAGDWGLQVRRKFLTLDGESRTNTTFQQGELVVVQLTISADRSRDNVVMEDLLPAGLEIENSRLQTTEQLSWLPNQQTMNAVHTDPRDDRMIVFADNIGTNNTFYYAVRAVTCGDFVLPGTTASCMYDPGVRSVGEAGRIQVVAGQ